MRHNEIFKLLRESTQYSHWVFVFIHFSCMDCRELARFSTWLIYASIFPLTSKVLVYSLPRAASFFNTVWRSKTFIILSKTCIALSTSFMGSTFFSKSLSPITVRAFKILALSLVLFILISLINWRFILNTVMVVLQDKYKHDLFFQQVVVFVRQIFYFEWLSRPLHNFQHWKEVAKTYLTLSETPAPSRTQKCVLTQELELVTRNSVCVSKVGNYLSSP